MLPENKPRYIMGVGYPEDIVVSVALGADMFDCVWPTRTARFGNALHPWGLMVLKNAHYAYDFRPVLAGCQCRVCRPRAEGGMGITRAYLHHLAAKETVGAHLITIHNVVFQMTLVKNIRKAIMEERFDLWVRDWFEERYRFGGIPSLVKDESLRDERPKAQRYPTWAVDALRGVGLDLLSS